MTTPAAARQTAEQLAALLHSHRYTWNNEAELHKHLAAVLTEAGHTVQREVTVAPRCRIDLVVDRTGIEVKVNGTPETVARQLQRYAHSDDLDALVLATTCVRHRVIPAELGGLPITVVNLTHLT